MKNSPFSRTREKGLYRHASYPSGKKAPWTKMIRLFHIILTRTALCSPTVIGSLRLIEDKMIKLSYIIPTRTALGSPTD